jgi:hypothetical protein
LPGPSRPLVACLRPPRVLLAETDTLDRERERTEVTEIERWRWMDGWIEMDVGRVERKRAALAGDGRDELEDRQTIARVCLFGFVVRPGADVPSETDPAAARNEPREPGTDGCAGRIDGPRSCM